MWLDEAGRSVASPRSTIVAPGGWQARPTALIFEPSTRTTASVMTPSPRPSKRCAALRATSGTGASAAGRDPRRSAAARARQACRMGIIVSFVEEIPESCASRLILRTHARSLRIPRARRGAGSGRGLERRLVREDDRPGAGGECVGSDVPSQRDGLLGSQCTGRMIDEARTRRSARARRRTARACAEAGEDRSYPCRPRRRCGAKAGDGPRTPESPFRSNGVRPRSGCRGGRRGREKREEEDFLRRCLAPSSSRTSSNPATKNAEPKATAAKPGRPFPSKKSFLRFFHPVVVVVEQRRVSIGSSLQSRGQAARSASVEAPDRARVIGKVRVRQEREAGSA